MMYTPPAILRAVSSNPDPRAAAAELHAQLWQPGLAAVVFFADSSYPRETLAAAMNGLFGDIPVAGITTAAEITPDGYRSGSLCGFSLHSQAFSVALYAVPAISGLSAHAGAQAAQAALQELGRQGPTPTGDNSFAMLLIDGSTWAEERVTHGLHTGLRDIELFGGTAGDGLHPSPDSNTGVFHHGGFHRDHAVLLLVRTSRPFTVFKTESFVPTETRMVITEADPARRKVLEIDGEPAALAYARLTGVPRSQLDVTTLARRPVGVVRRGRYYTRAISSINPDESLSFACAIDVGVVLSLAQATDLLENLSAQLARVRAEIGQPELLIACDCVLRYHDIAAQGLLGEVNALMSAHAAIGFCTYGEQHNSMHINHTLAGVAIGR